MLHIEHTFILESVGCWQMMQLVGILINCDIIFIIILEVGFGFSIT